MMGTFQELARDHRGTALNLWSVVIRDLCRSLACEHLDAWTNGMRRPALKWMLACLVGASASGVLIFVFMQGVNWIVPPQMRENGSFFVLARNLPRGVYGAIIGAIVGAAQAVAVRAHIRNLWLWTIGTVFAGAMGFPLGLLLSRIVGIPVVGYTAGVLLVGALIGTVQAVLLRQSGRAALGLICWNAVGVAAGIWAGVGATVILGPPQRTFAEWVIVWAVVPSLVGAVIGLLTVGPLTKAIARIGGSPFPATKTSS